MEGYEGVEALGGFRPPTAVVLQGRTPETRHGCASGGGEGRRAVLLIQKHVEQKTRSLLRIATVLRTRDIDTKWRMELSASRAVGIGGVCLGKTARRLQTPI